MKKVVTIGGGTGSFVTLRGIKNYPFDITAIVSTFDSGGSSGVLRDEYGILPPGDIRRCLVALSDDSTQSIVRELFNYRFDKDGTLQGHNFGNLLLTALTQIEGNYPDAITKASQILNCKGTIYPVALESAHLCAELEDGQIIKKETNIDVPKHNPYLKIKKIFLDSEAVLYEKAEQAILEADLIVVCPGDLYTSVIPNFLVSGIQDVLRQSKAKKLYICNLMTKLGETHEFKVSDFAKEILRYSGLEKFDYMICNTKKIDEIVLQKYASENQYPVVLDQDSYQYADQIIEEDLFIDGEVLRHDSNQIGAIIEKII